jgi:hypothetical protein
VKLIELAETWEEWAAAASLVAAEMDDRSAAHLRALAEARVQDATDLRNLLKDQET